MLTAQEIEEIKQKPILTWQDVQLLIMACEWYENRNDTIGRQLEMALREVVKLRERLDFYRRTTVKVVSG